MKLYMEHADGSELIAYVDSIERGKLMIKRDMWFRVGNEDTCACPESYVITERVVGSANNGITREVYRIDASELG